MFRLRSRLFAVLALSMLWCCVQIAGVAAQTAPAGDASGAQQASQPAAQAQQQLPAEIAGPIDRLTKGIEDAEHAVQQLKDLDEGLGRLRTDVEGILTQSTETAEKLRPRLEEIRGQIEKLGPPPGKDAPAETPSIAGERTRLTTEATVVDGAIKAAELTWVRARQLIERITVLRHSLFARNLLQRLPSPLLPALWRDAASKYPAVGWRVNYLWSDWWSWAQRKQLELSILVLSSIAVFLVLRLLAWRLTNRNRFKSRTQPPSFFERALSVSWTAPARMLPGVAAALLLYGGLDAIELLFPPWDEVGAGGLKGILLFVAVATLVKTVLAPKEPAWRLVELSDASARRITRLLQGIAAVYALDYILTECSRAFFVPLALSVVQSFATSLAFAALLIGLLLTPFTPKEGTADGRVVSRHDPRWLKAPLWVIALGLIGVSLLGYVSLGRFIAQQIVVTGVVALIAGLGYLAIRALTREPSETTRPVGSMLEARFGLDAPKRNQIARLTEAALTIALGFAILPVLMLQWGFSGADIRDWLKSLLFGFEIGQFRISLARILLGIVLFVALLLVTRLIQRWLRDRVLNQARVDPGISNSIETVAGYTGIGLAALLAISYAGFDITNLAIVAGALSVGIGFGLQSIVNNFVSGLILLIERPVKVGDWIVVGTQEGIVRRISVRATEIETFDRASLIIPNSLLITGTVTNWTHRNMLGRVVIRVSTSPKANPDVVLEVLSEVARKTAGILEQPEPLVAFDTLGREQLEFSLSVHVADITRTAKVKTSLRRDILVRLRERNADPVVA